MTIAHSTVTRKLTALVLLAGLTACSDDAGPMAPGPEASRLDAGATSEHFTVYSRNVFLGGDTGPLFGLDFGDLGQVLQATNVFWAQVQDSDPRARMVAIVDDIEVSGAHLVGLQEVFDFRVLDFSSGAPSVAVDLDLLDVILEEIAHRALPYELVAVQENTTTGDASGLPLAFDLGAGAVTRILQFTDRIAVLRRTDVDVTVGQGRYAATFDVGPLTLTRGWIRASTDHVGAPHHFFTTHLETQALAPIQAAQAQELLGSVMAGLEGVTILSGDLNSDAAAGPGAPSWTPTYETLLSAGFTDAWTQSGQPAWDDGFTCCQNPDLRNGASALDERIDFVLVRSSDNPSRGGMVPGSIWLDIVGDEADARTPGGLWASDHAGLIASMRTARGLFVDGG